MARNSHGFPSACQNPCCLLNAWWDDDKGQGGGAVSQDPRSQQGLGLLGDAVPSVAGRQGRAVHAAPREVLSKNRLTWARALYLLARWDRQHAAGSASPRGSPCSEQRGSAALSSAKTAFW